MAAPVEEDGLITVAGSNSGHLTVTNAVWVAAALLHRREPQTPAFAAGEIVRLVRELRLTEAGEESVWTHVRQHCVANKKPQPNRACVLFDTGGAMRRLFRSGDWVHPGKDAGKRHPRWEDLPARLNEVRRWYEEEWDRGGVAEMDPLLALVGTWKWESADEYVAGLRAGGTNEPDLLGYQSVYLSV